VGNPDQELFAKSPVTRTVTWQLPVDAPYGISTIGLGVFCTRRELAQHWNAGTGVVAVVVTGRLAWFDKFEG
jgi:hypothetical protein